MEWLLIPGIIVVLLTLGYASIRILVEKRNREDWCMFGGIVGVAVFAVALVVAPSIYYDTRTEALKAEAYYQYVALPHMVEEYDDHIVVESIEGGLWQAGGMNIATYNAYLKSMRWWDSIPVIGTVVYGPPSYLKYVEVQ